MVSIMYYRLDIWFNLKSVGNWIFTVFLCSSFIPFLWVNEPTTATLKNCETSKDYRNIVGYLFQPNLFSVGSFKLYDSSFVFYKGRFINFFKQSIETRDFYIGVSYQQFPKLCEALLLSKNDFYATLILYLQFINRISSETIWLSACSQFVRTLATKNENKRVEETRIRILFQLFFFVLSTHSHW